MIKHAAEATHYLVTCRNAENAYSEEGISIACIPTDREGIKIDSFATIDGGRVSDLTFTNVSVSSEELVGELGMATQQSPTRSILAFLQFVQKLLVLWKE